MVGTQPETLKIMAFKKWQLIKDTDDYETAAFKSVAFFMIGCFIVIIISLGLIWYYSE